MRLELKSNFIGHQIGSQALVSEAIMLVSTQPGHSQLIAKLYENPQNSRYNCWYGLMILVG